MPHQSENGKNAQGKPSTADMARALLILRIAGFSSAQIAANTKLKPDEMATILRALFDGALLEEAVGQNI